MREKTRLPWLAAALGVFVLPLVWACTAHRAAAPAPAAVEADEDEVPPALARKLAAMARFSPGGAVDLEDNSFGYADQDWLEHNTDGQGDGPAPFTAFATARNDWAGMKARPAAGTGAWVPYGPTNGVNDLTNPYR